MKTMIQAMKKLWLSKKSIRFKSSTLQSKGFAHVIINRDAAIRRIANDDDGMR